MTSSLSPLEIYEHLERVVKGYQEALDRYSDEQFTHKSAEDVWSLGQMYEHLVLTSNFFFLANTLRCLEQRKGQWGGEKNKYGDNIFEYNSFPPVKIKIPEAVRGPEPVAKTRAAYGPLLEKVLNAREWYHNMEMHFKHHLRQQAELEGILKG